jgi:membrane protein
MSDGPSAIVSRSRDRWLKPFRLAAGGLPGLTWLLRETIVASYRDGILGYAKGAAYSALLAFFPLLATAAVLLFRVRAEFVAEQMTRFLSTILPPGTEDLVFYYFTVSGERPVLIPVTAMAVSVLAASGGVVSLMQGFKAAYRIPTGRSFFRERLLAILLVVSAVIPALVASALILLGVRAERWLVRAIGLLPATAELRGWVSVLGAAMRYVAALASIVLGTTILYYFGPNRPQRWRWVWPGAVFATLLWFGATMGFAWYARNIAQYNVMYGSIATAVLLLVWMYVLAVIGLLGCEFNAAYERYLGRHTVE